ncbi:MAG: transposase [Gemmatimonadota bacterium]|nr:transposase [Gemmatimonadota bacterium]
MRTYYVGMDVHRASIMMVVLNGAGKVVMQLVLETGAERVRGFLKQLRGKVYVTFEEGTQAGWLHDVVRPLVTEVVVCDPRHNKLVQSGNKNDRVDAQKLAELLRNGSLRAVYHGDNGARTLKELVRNYDCLVSDTTRVMLRLKAIFRGRAIACGGHDIYRSDRGGQWLEKLREPGARQRASFLYKQLAALKPLRHEAKLVMVKEARRQPAYPWLMSVPRLGSVSVAQLLAVVGTPYRFRSKRQFWTYVGLAVVTRSSADHEVVEGVLRRSRRPIATRGLNRNHNHLLKKVFKSAATSACHSGPFKAAYDARVKQGMDPSLARLTVARQLAATTLAIWKRGQKFNPERMKQQTAA